MSGAPANQDGQESRLDRGLICGEDPGDDVAVSTLIGGSTARRSASARCRSSSSLNSILHENIIAIHVDGGAGVSITRLPGLGSWDYMESSSSRKPSPGW
jgi:hypothetical protein